MEQHQYEVTVIPADDPKKVKIGWNIEERIGPHMLPSNDKSCYETDIADKFLGCCGENVDKLKSYAWTVVPVLEFLCGQPWNNLALNYVMALRPSYIRVTTGRTTADARTWRVTVYLESDNRTIRRIEQECNVGRIGCEDGYDLQLKLKQQTTGKKIEQFDASCNYVNYKALEKIELETNVKST